MTLPPPTKEQQEALDRAFEQWKAQKFKGEQQ